MNAKEELIEILKDKARVKCATIKKGRPYSSYDEISVFTLKCNYNGKEYEDFLESLNFLYYDGYDGYGGQELDGTVWLEDNTWLERGEYDGSEWWNHKVLPEIPEELK